MFRYIPHSIHEQSPASVFSLICIQLCTGHVHYYPDQNSTFEQNRARNIQLIHSNCINHELYSEPSFPAPQLYLLRHTLQAFYLCVVWDGSVIGKRNGQILWIDGWTERGWKIQLFFHFFITLLSTILFCRFCLAAKILRLMCTISLVAMHSGTQP